MDGDRVLDIGPWPGLELVERVAGGARNDVWRGVLDGVEVAVRRSRRSPDSLAWELDLIDELDRLGFVVPTVIPTADGSLLADGVVAQRWLGGHAPASARDWRLVAGTLRHLHAVTTDWPQRPGCSTTSELRSARRSIDADLDEMPADVAGLIVDVFAEFADVPTAVVHGDPGASNLRITPNGRVGLLDFDESRVDHVWHDLSNLGVQALDDAEHDGAQRLSDAWECANAWLVEPAYARDRLRSLRERLDR